MPAHADSLQRIRMSPAKIWQGVSEYSACIAPWPPGDTVEGSIPGAVQVMQQLGVPYQYLPTAAELNQRWPMQARSGFQGVFEPGAGAIQVCISAVPGRPSPKQCLAGP